MKKQKKRDWKKLVKAWENFKPVVPLSFIIASSKASREARGEV